MQMNLVYKGSPISLNGTFNNDGDLDSFSVHAGDVEITYLLSFPTLNDLGMLLAANRQQAADGRAANDATGYKD